MTPVLKTSLNILKAKLGLSSQSYLYFLEQLYHFHCNIPRTYTFGLICIFVFLLLKQNQNNPTSSVQPCIHAASIVLVSFSHVQRINHSTN